jgi:hypothetical protein
VSKNQLIELTLSKPKLSLNLKNIDEFFPGFMEGDFGVIHGSWSVATLTSLLCVRAQLAKQLGGLGGNIVFVDGGNSFNLYQVAKLARVHHLNPRQVLEGIHISRAFTAYQVTALVLHKLKEAVKQFDAKLVVISDIAGFFLDKDVDDEEAKRVFSQVTVYLSNFARENKVVLLATLLPHKDYKRNCYLQALLSARANVVLSLRQTKYSRAVALEKHPYLNLGSFELPTNHLTLLDFMGGSD